MKIITISGAQSGVGKTTVAERLLKAQKGWSALKVTVLHKGACPIARDCGACEELDYKFSIISDKDVIEEDGKDTQRLKNAGAKKVLWLKARPEGLQAGLRQAISKLQGSKGIIIEGTSILKYLKPDLAIMVKKEASELFKPSAREALKKVDIVLNL